MWTVIPVKALQPVKSRLAPVLTPEQCGELMRVMLTDMLRALRDCPKIEGVLVISRDTGIAPLAEEHGAGVLAVEQDRDLNSAVQAGIDHLDALGVSRALVLHGDLPLLNADLLTRLVEEYDSSALSLLPCRKDQGSNALLTPVPARTPFLYGQDSYIQHMDAASQAGMEVCSLQIEELALDVDTPEDLLELCRYYRGHSQYQNSLSYRYLQQLGLLHDTGALIEAAGRGSLPSAARARSLALVSASAELSRCAATIGDQQHGNIISYSRKVFIPLTHLCRDVCHYCTFARVPRQLGNVYMSVEEVLAVARKGVEMGCKEALLTLGERPELRYSAAREALAGLGFSSTLEYVAHVAKLIYEETGLLPHINAGCMDASELAMLRDHAPSMGIMLESSSDRLGARGMPHHGSPDKVPARRLETMELAGELKIPFTSGILIGIGETRLERIEALLALRDLQDRFGHIQEVIIQNFRAKPGTLMAAAPEPDLDDLCWTIAVARIILGGQMNIQAPPNLVPGSLEQVIAAGINDLGGISPLTPDYVNPEAPWPHLDELARQLETMGKFLQQRLTLYPEYVRKARTWTAPPVQARVLKLADGQGYAREDNWLAGISDSKPVGPPGNIIQGNRRSQRMSALTALLQRCRGGDAATLGVDGISRLFEARGEAFDEVCQGADELRAEVQGDAVSFVINRNINYTNICYFKCRFCAFSKGKVSADLRDRPYDLGLDEIQLRTVEANELGATEVCLQGGIHPRYTGQHYIDICHAIKEAVPRMHIHAFSPLEVWQGASTLGVSLKSFLNTLRDAGLGSLPGTAAEILHDEVRQDLCADKINTRQWLEVMDTAHSTGLNTTATIMFGHIDTYRHWAHHLLVLRDLQSRTGGFTEMVPLPFVAQMAPIYRRGQSRRGPTFREAVLMHAVSRLVLFPHITNIQASWVKMGREGVKACLQAGANDLGGTLINESITRSAGASHGQGVDQRWMRDLAAEVGRTAWQRNTLYTEEEGGNGFINHQCANRPPQRYHSSPQDTP